MGCCNICTKQDIQQLRNSATWNPVPSDKRYEEKIVQYPSGRITRMTRPVGRATNPDHPDYPHFTEFYDPKMGKDHYDKDPRWDSHYSTGPGKGGQHYGTHRTAQSILDDLDEALRSMR